MAAWPSPMSITPAFSPGPWITHGALVGSFFSHTFEDLYEQCSLHIAEKMPSSTIVGVRPMILSRPSYSSGARPCSATTCGVIVGSFGSLTGGFFSAAIVTTQYSREGLDNTFEQRLAVGAAEHRFGGVLRMRHQAHQDRKSTRLNSSHTVISYAVFCLKKKKKNESRTRNGKTREGKKKEKKD